MMSLDEAIQHCLEVADEKEQQSGFETDYETYRISDIERKNAKCVPQNTDSLQSG